MLNKDVFAEHLKLLKRVYPDWGLQLSDVEAKRTWYDFFSGYTDAQFKKMVNEYIKNEKYNPTIAGLRHYQKGVYYY